MYDVGLVDRLHYWLDPIGVPVVEVDGWRSRGRTYAAYAPRGSVDHHTAGPNSGDAPSLGICINGRSDLPGPLCQVLQSRQPIAYLIAAGVANHAGRGGWNGLAGNQSVGGLEIENNGVDEFLSDAQVDSAVRIHCALITAPGSPGDPANSCQHREWSTEGKIDFHDWPTPDLQQRIAARLVAGPGGTPVPIPPEDDDVLDNRVFYAKRKGDAKVQQVGMDPRILPIHVTTFKVAEFVMGVRGLQHIDPPTGAFTVVQIADGNGDVRNVAEVGDGDILRLP